MAIRYSKHFGAWVKDFENRNMFNAFYDQDSRFHIGNPPYEPNLNSHQPLILLWRQEVISKK